MKPWSLPVFLISAILLPLALLIRSGVLVPRAWSSAAAHAGVGTRLGAGDQPRVPPPPARRRFRAMVFWQELGASAWAIFLLGWSATHGWRPLAIGLAVISATAVLNQIRTLVAHLWENEGDAMTVTGQYLDSVNVPPPALLAPLWAPVGLRYHALHHLLPSMPYHSLGEAHRRLRAQLGGKSTYEQANYPGLLPLVGRLARSTMGAR
jgi:fatty acid desaturase